MFLRPALTTREETDISSLVTTPGANSMGNLAAEQATPGTVNRTGRTREYLTQCEIDKLMDAARSGSRYGHRDATMILIAYRHGLRASEVCDLQWCQVDFNAGTLRVRRRKQGSPGTHPLQDDEIRALRRLQRGTFVFLTERDGPMTPKAFHALFARIGQRAELPFPVHPHMLRHTCGYLLANTGHDIRSLQAYLGHKNIQHTVRYTEMAPDRFRGFCPDPLPHPQEHKTGRGSDLSADPALDLKGHGLTEDNGDAIAELMRVGLTREQAKDFILEACGPTPTTKRKTTNR
jgi:type 1 fimbriae regulatory protein FimB/type 1 fimbriae regulatory protein FimE